MLFLALDWPYRASPINSRSLRVQKFSVSHHLLEASSRARSAGEVPDANIGALSADAKTGFIEAAR
jgi:hypothetical protein